MIRLIKPYISYAEVEDDLKSILDGGILTKGPYSHRLPEMMSEYTGARYSFNTTSATTALSVCLQILGVGEGDEVIVSDFSFPATVNVVEDLHATPVFADVSLETYNMLPSELEAKLSDKTKAVIFVDALGNPSGLDAIQALCTEHGVPLVEDAACAIGSSINGVKCGNYSDLTCFSFHPRKLLTCGEGGQVQTNNREYAESLQVKLNHGADGSGHFVTYGYNYRLPEIACALGCAQIPKLDDIVASRRDQQARYAEALEPYGYRPQASAETAFHNMQSVVFTVPENVDRDRLVAYLREHEVESTIGTYCLSGCDYYRERYHDVQPNAWFLQNNTITLPCYEDVPVEEVSQIIADFQREA